ncbi:MAG: iron-containing alcohol dehydrogenase [Planctomycetota bacterium]|nr:iron-containing alcohol dehydrogenase [Planctomycetota bacterium]
MDFVYTLPVKIVFGGNKIEQLSGILGAAGLDGGLLVSDPAFRRNGLADRVIALSGGKIAGCFSELSPNPDVEEVECCVATVRESGAGFLVALGGGSSMDCAKAASVVAGTDRTVRHFHSEKGLIREPGLPVIAVPTTAGTGSEVTNVAVLTDAAKNFKGPMASDYMYVKLAIVDPTLTVSVPKQVTASTGLDVLSHALEGYWSRNHQPICDAMALYAADLVFKHLETAYRDGSDIGAREQMCVASLLAGLAFAHPKTAASHACSFPLTNVYHLPHGEACAFTLDWLIRVNAGAEGGRVEHFARKLGFADAAAMADRTLAMKKAMGMRYTLAGAGIAQADLEQLAELCKHPNLLNNPVEMTRERLLEMFESMQ